MNQIPLLLHSILSVVIHSNLIWIHMFAGLNPVACAWDHQLIYCLTVCTATKAGDWDVEQAEPPKRRENSVMLVSVTLMYTLVFCLYELQSVAVSFEYLVISPLNNSLELTGRLIQCFEWLLHIMSVAYWEHKMHDGTIIRAISLHIFLWDAIVESWLHHREGTLLPGAIVICDWLLMHIVARLFYSCVCVVAGLRDLGHELMTHFAMYKPQTGWQRAMTAMLEGSHLLGERCLFSELYSLFLFRYITDSAPAVFVALLLFILPAHKPKFTGWNPSTSDPEQTEEGI